MWIIPGVARTGFTGMDCPYLSGRLLLGVSLPNRRYEIFAKRAAQVVPRCETPIASRGRIIYIGGPAIDDALAFRVHVRRDLRLWERVTDDSLHFGGRGLEGADVVHRPRPPLSLGL